MRELQKSIHQAQVAKGWWGDDKTPDHYFSEKMANIFAEVAEVWEAYRDDGLNPAPRQYTGQAPPAPFTWLNTDRFHQDEEGKTVYKPEGIAPELADVVIRIMDLAEKLGIDLEAAIEMKQNYNRLRAPKHNKIA
jgi:NTP pyrophosphatase (non-canonical NTP hydrolase)